MKFVTRRYEVDAEYFDGTEECAKRLGLVDWLLWLDGIADAVLVLEDGRHCVSTNHWIVRNPVGWPRPVTIMDDAEFRARFEPVNTTEATP